MKHLFLDLETLDLRPSAAITEIGAVAFDPATFSHTDILELFVAPLDQVSRGRTIDPGTVEWHRSKGHTIDMDKGITLPAAMDRLAAFVALHKPDRVWIWGADFDRPILEDICRMLGRESLWEYHATLDARTIWSLAFPNTRRPSRTHTALDDCLCAISDLKAALSHLSLNLTPMESSHV